MDVHLADETLLAAFESLDGDESPELELDSAYTHSFYHNNKKRPSESGWKITDGAWAVRKSKATARSGTARASVGKRSPTQKRVPEPKSHEVRITEPN